MSNTVVFQYLFRTSSNKTRCYESQNHPDAETPAIVVFIFHSVHSFMTTFNLVHSAFKKTVNIPHSAGAEYKLFEGSLPDAYLTIQTKKAERRLSLHRH